MVGGVGAREFKLGKWKIPQPKGNTENNKLWSQESQQEIFKPTMSWKNVDPPTFRVQEDEQVHQEAAE